MRSTCGKSRFWCSMRFADFSFFSIWFSVFVKKILAVFRFWYPMWFLVFPIFFPIWTYLGIQFCMRFSALADFCLRFCGLDEFFFGFAVSSMPQCPPHSTSYIHSHSRSKYSFNIFCAPPLRIGQYKTWTADYGLGTKHGLRYKTQTRV